MLTKIAVNKSNGGACAHWKYGTSARQHSLALCLQEIRVRIEEPFIHSLLLLVCGIMLPAFHTTDPKSRACVALFEENRRQRPAMTCSFRYRPDHVLLAKNIAINEATNRTRCRRCIFGLKIMNVGRRWLHRAYEISISISMVPSFLLLFAWFVCFLDGESLETTTMAEETAVLAFCHHDGLSRRLVSWCDLLSVAGLNDGDDEWMTRRTHPNLVSSSPSFFFKPRSCGCLI
mmetsp:Transcript_23473/g.66428  ORF Transcript_23473/g.66428 Transcript_23473/m.66428 type:complete len:232 (-) Transcript_23473:196-891(-)